MIVSYTFTINKSKVQKTIIYEQISLNLPNVVQNSEWFNKLLICSTFLGIMVGMFCSSYEKVALRGGFRLKLQV